MRNLGRANGGLQIVVGLRGRAAGFQNVGQGRQTQVQPCLGRLVHGLSVLQVRVGSFLQPFGVEQAVISLHYAKDDPADGCR